MKRKIYNQVFCNIKKKNFFDKVSIIDGANKITYREIFNKVEIVSINLSNIIYENKIISPALLLSSNTPLAICAILSFSKINHPIVVMSEKSSWFQINDFIKRYRIKLVLYNFDDFYNNVAKYLVNKKVKIERLTNLLEIKKHDRQIKFKSNNKYIISLSSGSTSKPKPIILSQYCKIKRALFCIESFNLKSTDIISVTSPIHHTLGLRLIFTSLILGSTMILYKNFNLNNWTRDLLKVGTTVSILISNHLNLLKQSNKIKLCKKLRVLVSSSSDITQETKNFFYHNLKDKFFEMYGTSETSTNSILNYKDFLKYPKSVGKICNNAKIKILNQTKKNHENIGEIIVNSKLNFSGYLDKKIINHSIKKYFLTGDLGYISNNYLYFISRSKRVIIQSGMNIFPSDIEQELVKLKNILNAIVVPRKDFQFGEIICAHCLIKNKIKNFKKFEIYLIDQLKKTLNYFQLPAVFFFHYKFKYLPSGKIDYQFYLDNYK